MRLLLRWERADVEERSEKSTHDTNEWMSLSTRKSFATTLVFLSPTAAATTDEDQDDQDSSSSCSSSNRLIHVVVPNALRSPEGVLTTLGTVQVRVLSGNSFPFSVWTEVSHLLLRTSFPSSETTTCLDDVIFLCFGCFKVITLANLCRAVHVSCRLSLKIVGLSQSRLNHDRHDDETWEAEKRWSHFHAIHDWWLTTIHFFPLL